MNIVYSHIKPGLSGWKKRGAEIKYLKNGKIKIPTIYLKSKTKTDKVFLIATGLHLEETSGPIFLLDSNRIFPHLRKLIKSMNVVLIPVINQRGLIFDEKGPDSNLRLNEAGIHYNTRWGSNSTKCTEVVMVEKYISDLFTKFNIIFVLSLHEDTTEPGKGYLWMNSINKQKRTFIQNYLIKHVPSKILCKLNNGGLRKGFVENKFTIVNSQDESFENFTSIILGIPTLLSEAPFGLSLPRRIFFHKTALNSIPFDL